MAVRCIGPAHVVFQVVDVSPGGEYVLRFSARGFGMGQTARRQVNWLDRDWRFLSTSLEVLNVTDAWRRYEMRAVAPDGAGHAVVYASCDGSGSAWFDDMSFIEAARR